MMCRGLPVNAGIIAACIAAGLLVQCGLVALGARQPEPKSWTLERRADTGRVAARAPTILCTRSRSWIEQRERLSILSSRPLRYPDFDSSPGAVPGAPAPPSTDALFAHARRQFDRHGALAIRGPDGLDLRLFWLIDPEHIEETVVTWIEPRRDAEVIAYGLPLRCAFIPRLYIEFTDDYFRGPTELAVAPPWPAVRWETSMTDAWVIDPIALAANTAATAAIPIAAMWAFRRTTAALRRRRGVCAACAYPLPACGRCPECGFLDA